MIQSVSHSRHSALKLDNSVSLAAVDNMLVSYFGWILWVQAGAAWWLCVQRPGAVWCVSVARR